LWISVLGGAFADRADQRAVGGASMRKSVIDPPESGALLDRFGILRGRKPAASRLVSRLTFSPSVSGREE
jgi:hypothetical protein